MDHPFLNLMGEGVHLDIQTDRTDGKLTEQLLAWNDVGLKRSKALGLFPYLLVWELPPMKVGN